MILSQVERFHSRNAVNTAFIPVIICAFLAAFLSGCASVKSVPPSPVETAYFLSKVETALSSTNQIVSMVFRGSTKELNIILKPKPGKDSYADAEADCLAVVKAMSNDPLIPQLGAVRITTQRNYSHQEASTVTIQQNVTVVGSQGTQTYSTPITIKDGGFYTIEIMFHCRINRSDLLQGKAPEVLHRNGRRASGVMKGFHMLFQSKEPIK